MGVEVMDDGKIDMWGDGKQTRSFMYVDECLIETLIKALPKNLREEAIDFIDYLLSKSRSEGHGERKGIAEMSEKLDPSKDPLLKYIGSIDHGSLARDIDKALYGDSL